MLLDKEIKKMHSKVSTGQDYVKNCAHCLKTFTTLIRVRRRIPGLRVLILLLTRSSELPTLEETEKELESGVVRQKLESKVVSSKLRLFDFSLDPVLTAVVRAPPAGLHICLFVC